MKIIIFIFLVFSTDLVLSQIESGKKDPTKPVKIEKIQDAKTDSELSIHVDYLLGNSFRNLKANKPFYSGSLNEKENEKAKITHSFNLGVEQKLKKNFYLSFGVSLVNYGEIFEENKSDSLLNYTNSYSNIACPLQIGYQTSGKITLGFSTGFQAQLNARYRNEITFLNEGKEQTVISKSNKNLSNMSIAYVLNFKAAFKISLKFSVFTGISYITQLNSTFNELSRYDHKPYLIGIKIGSSWNL